MTIDNYKLAFQEEARELLGELESALLELDVRRDDRDVVGRVFRALHTIKGSGAMFGFDDIAAFSHGLETAFDLLRSGQLSATSDLINLTLAAGDQIKTMLDSAAGNGTVDDDRSAAILLDLRKLTGLPETGAPVAAPQVQGHSPQKEWRIRFRPGSGVLVNGTNPLLLLRELRELGTLRLTLDTGSIPRLTHIDPESCFLAWDIVLTTTAPVEVIRDVFIFVEDDSELSIDCEAAVAVPSSSGAEPRSAVSLGADSSIRVSTAKLDQLVNLVGELVTVQARLSEVAGRFDDPEILEISEAVDGLTSSLRENSMSIRMLPLRTTFDRFRRLVHDLSRELHKDVELSISGADTELDKTVIDQLNDPLVHLIRNSMDHGIEPPEERRAANKRPTGTIQLSAMHSGANVLIRVSDDGRGVNVEAVRARAIERGLIDTTARLTQAETLQLIFAAGFSTATKVSAVSGRGVGMDVVRRSVEALRGSIDVESNPGAGVAVTLRLPLTLAIIDGLLVRVGRQHFVLPLANSLECVELTRQDIADAHGKHIANLRGELIPYIRLSEYFQIASERAECEQIMVVETDQGRYGFVVDQVLGDHQTVIKNLGRLYRNVQVVSGATILGNGTVALILDPNRLVQNVVQLHSQKIGSAGGAEKIPSKDSTKKENRIDGTDRKE